MTKKIITVSRQFGSGGRTIAKAVAKRLGLPYYSKDLVDRIAERSGFSPEFVQEIGEYASVTNSFLFNIAVAAHTIGATGDTMSASDKLYVCQSNMIKELAEEGPCVIVGRCADYILRDRDDVLNVFIHADNEHRAARVLAHYGENGTPINKRLADKDARRKVYYKHYTNRNWGEANNYHICLNSGLIGVEKCIDIICDIAEMD